MSSEESDSEDDVIIVKPLQWRNERVALYFHRLDEAEATKHSKKMSQVFRDDKTSTAFKLMLSPPTAGDLYQQKAPSFLYGQLGTERNSWITSNKKSTLGMVTKVNAHSQGKKTHLTIMITVMQLETGMHDCLRNNIYCCGLSVYIYTYIEAKATYY